jgi:hypothetical protein
LDLTVEAHVLKAEFDPLFTDADRDQARDRLEAYGWRPCGSEAIVRSTPCVTV